MERGNEGFLGWSNFETWNVNLWLNNDELLYHATRGFTADELKSLISDMFSISHRFGELKSEAELGRVNWDEVAEANEKKT